MLGSAIIVFRETFEAALIIGIIAAVTRSLPGRNRWLALGVLAGIAGSGIVASLAEWISNLAEGTGQEIFNAGVLGIAAAMLAWHNIWMARHGAQLARDARQLGLAVREGNREMSALALVIALAVLREGSETALFLYGLLAGGSQTLADVLAGGALGLAAGAASGYALYSGFVHIPARLFFSATSGLILLLASAMASQMARFLAQADFVPSLATPLWDTSWLLDDQSTLGRFLHTLVGYEAMPSGIQVLFYVATALLILGGMRLARSRPPLLATS
ncbi:MAG TPA: FTR1 family protein [Rhodocyclaceae bacterium]|jgi:high-affinity iron transporter|nr:FTR1 family protein [Betaproteobacteria bacterium]HMV00936.1 FTR1 family protein [Rhodocyclaceae bacterium]HMV20889.1 FTR1 family protein [Rhodocyclaceae bacterium]HNL21584.1 FTR1 family protein [Rhodocyclaceae bacterium]HNM22311.1 FTR1 family protein [Rhodocyclaceae bacterium]